jgi:hypothetical protein
MTALPSSQSHARQKPRVMCFVNGIFAEGIGGGDIDFYQMARAVIDAGYPIHFFGGHALKRFVEKQNLPPNLTLTDPGPGNSGFSGISGGGCEGRTHTWKKSNQMILLTRFPITGLTQFL